MKSYWLLLSVCLFFSGSAFADSIQKTQGNKVLILLDQPDSVAPDERVFALDSNGKKKALIQIEKVKGNKATGSVKKGKAEKDMMIEKAQGGGEKTADAASASSSKKKKKRAGDHSPFSMGALVGVAHDTMKVGLTDAAGNIVETINMAGIGFSAKAFADYNFTSYLGVRLFVGMEKLAVAGAASSALCDGTDQCKTDIMYVTLDGWLRYAFVDETTKIWIGAGFGAWLPGTKTSNNLDAASIAATNAIYIGGGADIATDSDVFIPVQVEYIILPSSPQVTANAIALRGGIGFRF